MNAKNNRLNHNFQILYMIVGKCHTPDAAYAILKDLQEDRELALSKAKSSKLKNEAKLLSFKKRIENAIRENDKIEELEVKAEIMDMETDVKLMEKNVKSAQDELEFINKLIDKVNPYREFKDLSDREAFELCQHDEWKYELLERAKINLLLTGGLTPEDYKNILRHPDSKEMLNQINETKLLIRSNPNVMIDVKPEFQIKLEKEFKMLSNEELNEKPKLTLINNKDENNE